MINLIRFAAKLSAVTICVVRLEKALRELSDEGDLPVPVPVPQVTPPPIPEVAKRPRNKNGNKNLRPWTLQEVYALKRMSKDKEPAAAVAKALGRTERAVRQKAVNLKIGLGHRR